MRHSPISKFILVLNLVSDTTKSIAGVISHITNYAIQAVKQHVQVQETLLPLIKLDK